MTIEFAELDYVETALGAISLRRRTEPRLAGKVVYEIKLGDEFLMSSLFTVTEVQLAKLALAALGDSRPDIIVGGLGLGCTAGAVLDDPCVRSVTVLEVLQPVIDWHRRGLVPLGNRLISDPRCKLVHADFFALAAAPGSGFDAGAPTRLAHAVLVDIDHSPGHWLEPDNSRFYTAPALRRLAEKLHPGGVFGLWSNDPPDGGFLRVLGTAFHSCASHVVTFPNPYTGGEASGTIYLARSPA